MMKRWFKRLGYSFLLLVWLIIMAFPTFAFLLATREELQFGEDPRSHLRLFLVQEEESSGLGIEWVRNARNLNNCARTSIRYLLWEGSSRGENVSFCQCYDPVTDAPLPVGEESCKP